MFLNIVKTKQKNILEVVINISYDRITKKFQG